MLMNGADMHKIAAARRCKHDITACATYGVSLQSLLVGIVPLSKRYRLPEARRELIFLLTCPGGTRQALDITVAHQQGDSAAEAARKARQRKESQYLGTAAGMSLPGGEIFVPIVHVAGGFLGGCWTQAGRTDQQ